MQNLIYQFKQFLRPFPEVGSWSYKLQSWWYDRQIGGRAEGSFNIEPSGEAVDDDSDKNKISDVPAYIRRDYGIIYNTPPNSEIKPRTVSDHKSDGDNEHRGDAEQCND